jgi:hypothetical protein
VSQIKAIKAQLGLSGTATQNFTLTAEAADGTMKLARGNAGATTQDLITVDATGNVQLTKTTAQSMVRLHTANGYGSTNTAIRRYTTTVTNQGTDITYSDSATLGASFTINTAGVYAISSYESFSSVNGVGGISLDSAQLTTSVATITIANRLAMFVQSAANLGETVAWTGYLPAGSVIRPHNDSSAIGSSTSLFTIVRVA